MKLADLEKKESSDVIIETIVSSANDWPRSVDTLDSFLNELEQEINMPLTLSNLKFYLGTIDYNTKAWESESISQLVDLFDPKQNEQTLNQIFIDVSRKWR